MVAPLREERWEKGTQRWRARWWSTLRPLNKSRKASDGVERNFVADVTVEKSEPETTNRQEERGRKSEGERGRMNEKDRKSEEE